MEEIHRGISKVFLKVIMMKLTGVVLTKNNQKEIKRCLLSLKFCEEIIIIDDYSTDGTLDEIQKLKQQFLDKCKIQIFQRRLNNFSEQRNFGMEKASGEWILFVDSDETVSQDLASEITKLLNGSMVNGYQAFYLKRRDYFWGKELKYGETQKIRKVGIIRLVKKDSGKWEGKVHEEYRVYKVRSYKVHKVESLNGYIEHYPHQTVKEFIESVKVDLFPDEVYIFTPKGDIKAGTNIKTNNPPSIDEGLTSYFLGKKRTYPTPIRIRGNK